jgi:hypothetical protein
MAAFSDDFSTDPFTSRWVNRIQTTAWDSVDLELDIAHVGSPTLVEYVSSTPGSLDQEAQVCGIASGVEPFLVSAAVRIDDANNSFYSVTGHTGASELRIYRRDIGGGIALLASVAFTFTAGNFYALRIAAEGATDVTLSAWCVDLGGSKPGTVVDWQGVDASPQLTYTDTAGGGLALTAAGNNAAGIGGPSAINTDFDTRLCYWKARAISDRSGGGGGTPSRPRYIAI